MFAVILFAFFVVKAESQCEHNDSVFEVQIENWFSNPTIHNTCGHISDWDVSNVTNLYRLFYRASASSFNENVRTLTPANTKHNFQRTANTHSSRVGIRRKSQQWLRHSEMQKRSTEISRLGIRQVWQIWIKCSDKRRLLTRISRIGLRRKSQKW